MSTQEDDKLRTILRNNFSEKASLRICSDSENIPLVAANVVKSTRSFSLGQLVYVYDVYWGMNQHAKVVGRFRRKHDWIRGVIPIRNLGRFRPKVVYEPMVLKKLQGETIEKHLFRRFLVLPEWTSPSGETDVGKSVSKRIGSWLKEKLRITRRM